MSFFMGLKGMDQNEVIKKEKSHVALLIKMGIELARTAGGYQLVNLLYMTERMFVKANCVFCLFYLL
ncbi:hypothetical protein BPUM_1267 [Bacillus pumilus SAFR-032]|uniref:Uncharacterized protein n=1 Tax=Bacillus pumilus (strain SAFR-032) TaxID=315750 RepID=A8FCI3_BACP2|nr:hypothetical protein BPUM_1267 [Bacillus pumilus SAFR-032]